MAPSARSASSLPWISVEQMQAVDREAIALGLSLERMMENAGANLAALAVALLGGAAQGRRIVVLAGAGGNGGGGLVAARRLAGWGADVEIRLAAEDDALAAVPRAQLEILRASGADVALGAGDLGGADLVVDAVLGYSQHGAPRGAAAALISASAGCRVLSLDVPSGLALGESRLYEPAVRAEATLTLALPKRGLRAAREALGALWVADISIPAVVYERLGIRYRTPFSHGPLVTVEW